MQSVRSRIWTRVAVSISCDDNHYTTGTSNVREIERDWKSSQRKVNRILDSFRILEINYKYAVNLAVVVITLKVEKWKKIILRNLITVVRKIKTKKIMFKSYIFKLKKNQKKKHISHSFVNVRELNSNWGQVLRSLQWYHGTWINSTILSSSNEKKRVE